MVQAKGSSPDGDTYQTLFQQGVFFISVLLGLMDFSDTVMLCSGPNSCCQQNLTCFVMSIVNYQ